MEGKATSDLARGTDLLNLETGTDRGQTGGAEGQSLRVVGLESLVLRAQAKQNRMLHIGGQNNALVASLTRHLDTEVPGSQGDESKFGSGTRAGVLVHEVLAGVCIEGGDSITVATGLLDMLPGQGGKGRAQRGDGSVCRADQNRLVVQLEWVSAGVNPYLASCRETRRRHIDKTVRTSGREGSFASTTTQPISITSALSLVT